MLAVSFPAADSPQVESPSATRTKRDADGPNASGINAFAAALANVMQTPMSPALTPEKIDAKSDLDANMSDAASAIGAGANDGKPALAIDAGMNDSKPAFVIGAGVNNGKPAFAAAAEARAAAAATPVNSPNSDTDALNPDFRARLGRVITRMRDEFGKDVELVEGFRTQSRQDFLYDQGRTRPGDVVTWTKSSKHTLGLAADVTIDGSYTDSVGYKQLAQIAAQEGLRTLGARDPGHIELPTRGGAVAWGESADTVNLDDNVSRAIGIALDQGNAIGNSEDDNASLSNFNGLLSRVGRGSATSAPPIRMPSMPSGGAMAGNLSQRGYDDSRKDAVKTTDTARVASVASVADVAPVASVAQIAQVAHVGGMMQVQPSIVAAPIPQSNVMVGGTDAADKVGRMLDARDAAPVQPMSQVTLNIDNANGGPDKVTVQLRAGTVDTTISLGDPNRADRMSLRSGELQHALERHGLDATAISVTSTASGSGPGWNPRSGSDQSAQNGRASLNYRDNRQDADGTRQRSRREQQGGREK